MRWDSRAARSTGGCRSPMSRDRRIALFVLCAGLPGAAVALLFGKSSDALFARSAEQLGLVEALGLSAPRTMDLAFPSGMGRWEVRTRSVRLGGVQHRLVVLSDLRRALREEERQAWQRLIRVLSHEINNSLTPIQSIAQSLQTQRIGPDEMREGLAAISSRAEAVSR